MHVNLLKISNLNYGFRYIICLVITDIKIILKSIKYTKKGNKFKKYKISKKRNNLKKYKITKKWNNLNLFNFRYYINK